LRTFSAVLDKVTLNSNGDEALSDVIFQKSNENRELNDDFKKR
jgi:hypothetical protein